MHYMGGKARHGKRIAAIIEAFRKPGQYYLEPFAGSLSVTQWVSGIRVASDANKGLITLYDAMQDGFIPPSYVSAVDYALLKQAQDLSNPLTAFVGIGHSFGGAWFSQRINSDTHRIKIEQAARSMIRKMLSCDDVAFQHCCYKAYDPSGAVIYCDPPYRDTATYKCANMFDHDEFWLLMRKWSRNNIVIISEYEAPDDFSCIAEFATYSYMHSRKHRIPRTDRLFRLIT